MTARRVLFLCTHNSARSQMAEGFLRRLAGDRFEVASAGTEATRVHPLALRTMAEVGIDLSTHTSKTLDSVLDRPWDYVITVCDSANERCPLFLGHTTRLHWSFDDPSPGHGERGPASWHIPTRSRRDPDAARGLAGDHAVSVPREVHASMAVTPRLAPSRIAP